MLARGPRIHKDTQKIEQEMSLHLGQGEKGCWLIFKDRGGVAGQLVELLRWRGETCLLVAPGEGFQRIDGDHFQISPNSPEDMERLLQAVSTDVAMQRLSEHQLVWRGVIHLWSLNTPPPEETSVAALQHGELLGCHSIMHFIQALSKIDTPSAPPHLILVTRGAQPVGQAAESVSIGQSPLIGLGRVISSEYPNIRCKLVDLGLDAPPDEIHCPSYCRAVDRRP